jgi:hypothetical protein
MAKTGSLYYSVKYNSIKVPLIINEQKPLVYCKYVRIRNKIKLQLGRASLNKRCEFFQCFSLLDCSHDRTDIDGNTRVQ